ncbi:MAG: cobalt-precorrin-5B (C(1))-methyltransferase [Pseudomonadales bacterium]|nr:cobalt-precorrin-5B (C(1))-methyltransferase [Pseudomonadales bacterium]
MWPESSETPKPLRTGFTTGSCATACCVAAASYLLENLQPSIVSVTLPKGKTVEMEIINYQQQTEGVRTATIKDAGDDPDITHGAEIFVKLALTVSPGIRFIAGNGVGTVTKPGLLLSVNEPAINPVPRQMMSDHLTAIAKQVNYSGGFKVTVGVVDGEQLALKTMNPRLGILGGLSILGTTGVVRPFSCAAWIASIRQGMDVAYANGVEHIVATTGNTSETTIKEHYQLTDTALIEMGDFAGAVLKHLKKTPLKKLSLCGGFGKISKLANGHLDLNSRVSAIDFEHLAKVAAEKGADKLLVASILGANTSIEALKLCQERNIALANGICEAAYRKARTIVPDSIEVEILAIDRKGKFVGGYPNILGESP